MTKESETPKIIPVVREDLVVDTLQVEGRTVTVKTDVEDYMASVTQDLLKQTVSVERIAKDQIVDKTGAIREEGDVTIIPIYEEFLHVEKRIRFVEEIRITRQTAKENIEHSEPLRRMTVDISETSPTETE